MKSLKPIKSLEDLLGKKTFFFPDDLSNDRIRDTHEKCIMLTINGKVHTVLTGKNIELDKQKFSTLKDAGIILPNYTYAVNPEFDPILKPYEA